MSIPSWYGVDGNLGTVRFLDQITRTIAAINGLTYSIVSSNIPDVNLTPEGVLTGTALVDDPVANIPIFLLTVTIRATSSTNETADKIFKLSVLANTFYVPPQLTQTRVAVYNNQFEYQINRGGLSVSATQHWQLEFGNLPDSVLIYQNGTIAGFSNRTLKPLSREQFLSHNAPNLPQLSQTAWEAWLGEQLIAPVGEHDYQFVSTLVDDAGPTQLSITVRVIYKKITSADTWFQTNQAYVTYDPDAYYVFVAASDVDIISWTTPTSLPNIKNGSVSDLSVAAAAATGKHLVYSVKPGYASRLPQGISFYSSGLLTGRVSFRCHQDDPATVPINDYYEFTIRARTSDGFTYAEKTFIWQVDRYHNQPYVNIWIRSFPSILERKRLTSILNNDVYFPPELIYRNNDAWFGKSKELRFLFAPGLKLAGLAEYNSMLAENHYTKTLLLGDISTAFAYDENLDIKYEVVYLPILDRLSVYDKKINSLVGLPDTIDLRPYIKNYYLKNGQAYYTLTPNGLTNMRNQLALKVGFYNKGILPDWMTSPQPIPNAPGKFYSPTGFIPAVVLVYTVPGGSDKIAFRLQKSGINFNDFKFEFDRYELDDNLASSFVSNEIKYVVSSATVFDNSDTTFEDATTKFNDNLDYAYGSGPLVGNKYLKFPKPGAFT